MGADPLSAKAVGMRLVAEYGVIAGKKHTQGKYRIYQGIGLTADADDEAHAGEW